MRGGPEHRERIDLIGVDPEVFTDEDTPVRRSRVRAVAKAVWVAAIVAVAAVAWWPRTQSPEWQVFHPAVVPAAGLSEQLVFDHPPGELLAVDLAPRPVDVRPELGYVFGEPGGTIFSRRWAAFRVRSTTAEPAPPTTDDAASIAGVAAEVRRVRVRHYLDWGPVAGYTWTATTNKFDEAEAIEFANHVAIIDERPALAHRYDLGALQPVGSVAAFDCVVMLTSLFGGDRLFGPVMPTLVTWGTPADTTALGSIAAPADALPLVEFVLGDGTDTTVHGQPAVVIVSPTLGRVIAWLEDGRLIMVSGQRPTEELIALAESVRAATDGEWRRVRLAELRAGG